MPFANRAHSTKIDKLLDDIDKHLENIQYAFIMVTALVIAADDASFYYVDAWKEGEEENPARDRLCALITMARAKSEELAREIDTAFKVLADRATWFVCWTAKGDANAKVDEGIDEAMFVLESAGVRPLTLGTISPPRPDSVYPYMVSVRRIDGDRTVDRPARGGGRVESPQREKARPVV